MGHQREQTNQVAQVCPMSHWAPTYSVPQWHDLTWTGRDIHCRGAGRSGLLASPYGELLRDCPICRGHC